MHCAARRADHPDLELDTRRRKFGAAPNLQSMAVYDSILMAAELATLTAINSQAPAATARTNNPYAFGQLTRPRGFNGLLGTFRLTANGRGGTTV